MKLKIGLLPLYVKLYDEFWPELRNRVNAFHNTICEEIEKRNIDVVKADVCRIKSEFANAVKSFENEDVDAIVTLHLAYSPSLESAEVLAGTKLPLIILDTTPTFDYSPAQHPDELLYNHGIHGVQDMCNLLVRNGKNFLIEAGHWAESDVLDRITDCIKSAALAKCMKNARVGRIGNYFDGMGDFALPVQKLHSTIGIETILYDFIEDRKYFSEITEEQIDSEIGQDERNYISMNLPQDIYRKSTKACLGVRKWIDNNQLTAFTVNFTDITRESGIPSMPFMEAGKAMSRGIGYAGEGDILTAALTGALLSVYPESSFVEMFCPDWKNNSIFISHMGEMNLSLASGKPKLMEKDFPFTDAENPIVANGRFKGGEAVLINLAPGINNTYSLIISPVEMLDVNGEDRMEDSIHGWFKPSVPVSDFLSVYSKHGGTHHLAVVYGDAAKVLEGFAEIMGWNTVKIG